jgi:peptidyl-prolyl cis-trans isomerase C
LLFNNLLALLTYKNSSNMMMKLLPTLALSVAATMTITGALSNPALAQNAAVVNGKAVPKAKLDKLIANSGQGTNPELRERARDMLITRELINQEAIKRGLLSNDNIQEQLEQARLNILVGAVFEDYIARDGVSDAELKASYDQIKTQFEGTEYKVRHILVEKEADAKALIAKIKAGEKFEDLAKASSKDPGSAVNGGDLDWMTPQALVPEFSKAMVALQKGQMTDKPVKSQFGFHVIRVDDVRQAKVPDLAELKPQLIQMMSQDQNWQRTKFDEMLKNLKAKAKIL